MRDTLVAAAGAAPDYQGAIGLLLAAVAALLLISGLLAYLDGRRMRAAASTAPARPALRVVPGAEPSRAEQLAHDLEADVARARARFHAARRMGTPDVG